MSNWLGVVSRNHVEKGVRLGIVQTNHGTRAGLARMSPGDWVVLYSPKTAYPVGDPLKAFTAIGQVEDAEIWQADEGDFHPFRRRVTWNLDAREAPIADFEGALDLTAGPNWGYQLRRGLLQLTDHDLGLVRHAMVE